MIASLNFSIPCLYALLIKDVKVFYGEEALK